MSKPEAMPAAVDALAIQALADGYHSRAARSLGTDQAGGHLVKVYALEAPGRTVTEADRTAMLRLAGKQLELGSARGSLGLAVLIVHAGGDGDYIILSSWIEGYMSDLALFVGPAGEPAQLRPGRSGLAPCVWEAVILAHERDAFCRHVLDGKGPVPDRLAAWGDDVIQADVR